MSKRESGDAFQILYDEFIKGDPEAESMYRFYGFQLELGQFVYDRRREVGLTQKELARQAGTSARIISRIEHADFTGHMLDKLRRVCEALGYEMEVKVVPRKGTKPTKSEQTRHSS